LKHIKVGQSIRQADAVLTFLNGRLPDPVYMIQPTGFEKGEKGTLCEVTSFAGLHLLQSLDMSDLSGGPHELLLAEMSRLENLEKQTLANWEAEGL
jgi:hypothetical protein